MTEVRLPKEAFELLVTQLFTYDVERRLKSGLFKIDNVKFILEEEKCKPAELKTSEEWSKIIDEFRVVDPDGWDRRNFMFSWAVELIAEEEYRARSSRSTCDYTKQKCKTCDDTGAVDTSGYGGFAFTPGPCPGCAVDEPKLIGNFDAEVWAEEFSKLYPDIDKDTMRGWFANAIMAGYDHAKNEQPVPCFPDEPSKTATESYFDIEKRVLDLELRMSSDIPYIKGWMGGNANTVAARLDSIEARLLNLETEDK